MMTECTELYRRYRPEQISQVVGQKEALAALAAMGKSQTIPHCLLFTGPSGCGKTTVARILRKKLKCSDSDFVEINASEERGIEMVRDIKKRMGFAPINGTSRVWLIDEAHAMTGDAQNAFLKFLEDTPPHVYFMLATTDPEKLKKTIITRSTEIRFKEISISDLKKLVVSVCSSENVTLTDEVVQRIAETAEGSARKCLVILHSVIGIQDETQQLAAIESNDTKRQAIEICKALTNPRTTWSQMIEVLNRVDVSDPEGLRYLVLAWCTSILLKGNNARAALIIEEFRDNWYDSKKTGLVISCYNVVNRGDS